MKISIFDNSIDIINRLKDLVKEAEPDCSIQTATNYKDALFVIVNKQPDVVVIDLNFHSNNSYEFLKNIKTQLTNATVIVLSIHIDEKVQSLCDMLGADYFFDKYHEFDKIPGIINALAAKKITNTDKI